ncbi:MAG TPA: glycogen debranching N-terminal domain-containing protein [bacterium]|nr:glycogen debranching N-terminal domain-containing protein [bacterium]
MPERIQLGPPRLALAEGTTLFVSAPDANIYPGEDHGLFVRDTRLLSRYRIRLGRRRWLPVTSAPVTHYSAQAFFVNPAFDSPMGMIRRGSVALIVERALRGGVHEDLEINNFGHRPAAFPLVIEVACDFADLFEIRRIGPLRERRIRTELAPDGPYELRWWYERDDFVRGLILRVANATSPPRLSQGALTFHVTVPPRGTWRACLLFIPVVGHEALEAPAPCHATLIGEVEERRQRWYQAIAALETPHDEVRHTYRQAVEDLTVLRLTGADADSEPAVVAAGLPWFATLFGRDSLIISLQTLPVTKSFAPAVLRALAALQARETDDFRDAQPGKILHEVRYGELAHFREIPHTPYYGSADATILFLIALHETWRWTADRALVEELLPAAERALVWIDHFGDLDGDGFQEYLRRSPRGIKHQGWKDSANATVHGDGSPVDPPVALVELQGYVYDAKRRMAALYDLLGRGEEAARLRAEAAALRERFCERFWWPEEATYFFALDGRKRPVYSVVSNAGHALWSGIALPDQARAVMRRLMAPDMFNGWGIRTLSSRHPAYNPYDYQVGAVWPHDNGLIAVGFRRYGFAREAARIAEGLFTAASWFQSYHLPELFAGLSRHGRAFPVQYREANVPQGWAAGAVIMLLQALLGLRADAPRRRVLLDPHLPEWLPTLTLRGLTVGAARFDLHAWRKGNQTQAEIDVQEGSLDLALEPWTPDEV